MTDHSLRLSMSPAPGEKRLHYTGDTFTVTLNFQAPAKGRAFLRSNLNRYQEQAEWVINSVEKGVKGNSEAWYDLEMDRCDDYSFSIDIPLLEVGHFEYKAFFVPEGQEDTVWPDGSNAAINVEPSDYRCHNSLYCAFPRQFGRYKSESMAPDEPTKVEELDEEGYAVIPPSGKFRDLINELDHIFETLGCRILHLLPVNPTPTVYARMGRFGSPYAALDFTAINPELAEFDLHKTPLDQFLELSDEVHARQGKLFIDIAINHSGWAAKLHETHPEWLKRNEDGSIHQPGAWGTVWEDLTELDHSIRDLWIYLAEVFLTWCERGVDGFRCDAGYMIPAPAWKYIVAKVRQSYPDSVFLLEGLGGPWQTTEDLLNDSNLNWAYSELFQNYDKGQIEWYLDYSQAISNGQGLMVHYAETHDNSRLAEKGDNWARMRTALSALLSHNGSFGFTNGVEWFAEQKIIVHRDSALNWGAEVNQVHEITQLNKLLQTHPAFFDGSQIERIDNSNGQVLTYRRRDAQGGNEVLIVLNLDCENSQTIELKSDVEGSYTDLLREGIFEVKEAKLNVQLAAGSYLCLAQESVSVSNYLRQQKVTWILKKLGLGKVKENVNVEVEEFLNNPRAFCVDKSLRSCQWVFPRDLKRDVLYAPESILIVEAEQSFSVSVFGEQAYSFNNDQDQHFAIIFPQEDLGEISYETLSLKLYKKEETKRFTSQVLRLSLLDTPFEGDSPFQEQPATVLDTNGRGGMMHLPLNWPNFYSRYDALLAANLNTQFPENRHIMWRRCRIYVAHSGFSYELNDQTMLGRTANNGQAGFDFRVPVGNGKAVYLKLKVSMLQEQNATQLYLKRYLTGKSDELEEETSVDVIFRPDLEDRDFHMETKSMGALEEFWSKAVAFTQGELLFAPDQRRKLRLVCEGAQFHKVDEWSYNCHMSNEELRGLSSQTDLYSPGYFEAELKGGEKAILLGQIMTAQENKKLSVAPVKKSSAESSYLDQLSDAIRHFVVRRDGLKTVIAGYPWFLDWGRDTLICVRGLIAAGMLEESEEILLQFAKFEEQGTLPNMICGGDASNRDTTDAPLWYFTACDDLMKAQGHKEILKKKVGERTVQEVLVSLAENYIAGTPNKIQVDAKSGLVYSPSHFTWMDTNYPAGTPRKGYPIEIQALWFKGLSLLAELTKEQQWIDLAAKVQSSVIEFYWDEERGFLSDCLHAAEFKEAKLADADDALRCNQLFAVTLGLVEGEVAKQVVLSSEELLVPGAIRSLGDRPVTYPLPVANDAGMHLNDQYKPFWGEYLGDEDTRRKPAYHNGTAWSWPFPSYSEALLKVFGDQEAALAILNSSRVLFDSGCLGQLPEVQDGDSPHWQRGCDAQAWGVTEMYRVLKLVQEG